jgi:prepilin-type N-terminal cleavage/methylation domain-containing protein/prepilin-type processing-associated H-X9-DG protein
MSRSRRGVTLVEILVVVAILGALMAVILPGVQAARESVRRSSCANNLRQIALAAHNHETARGRYPVGAESRQWDARPDFPHQFFRWSLLAHLAPFYEQEDLLRSLDLSVPLYVGLSPGDIAPQNKPVVNRTIPLFLCPSDRAATVSEFFGPTNYAGCTGSGAGGGTPFDTDGMFFINSQIRPRQVTDGLSNTVMFSESTLGDGPRATTDRGSVTVAKGYGFVFTTPLTEAACDRPFYYNFTDLRGFSWANGEYRTTLYNHARQPNDPALDCLAALMTTADKARMYAGYGWRAARSLHAGGVNVAMADGRVAFVRDDIDPAAWRAAATRSGGETTDLDRR